MAAFSDFTLLDRVGSPADLRQMSPDEIPRLAQEIRDFLVDRVAASGGHLGPNLGMVEVSIALHRVFNSPTDTLLFDTGHQAYVHKLLTGRAERFDRLRQADGLSGYPSRAESEHDVIENSHASTAVAYADGLAKAYELRGDTGRCVVAVLGDGALTGGLAYESLNNLGSAPHRPVIVVLNDNGRSYSPTVGGIAEHLSGLRSAMSTADRSPGGPGDNFFSHLGLAYVGPVDGHDEPAVERALRRARNLGGPVVVHCVTRKGYGYAPAEDDENENFHAVGVIDAATGYPLKPADETWTDVFAKELCHLGQVRQDLVAITAAMGGPTGLSPFAVKFPERYFDVGIAEQHALASAAGLVLAGAHPVVAIYSTFLNRAFDQLVMDVAMHRSPVTLVLDRAGITGPDGASHHGMWDLPLLGMIPGLRVAAPRDPARLRELLGEAVEVEDGPTVLRFPKAGAGADVPAVDAFCGMDVLATPGDLPADVLLVGIGVMAGECLRAAVQLAAHGIGATVVDPRWVLPVNHALPDLAARHALVVTVEDANRVGGVGAGIAQACADAGIQTPVRNLGLPRSFIEHGSRAELLTAAGLTPDGITELVLRTHRRPTQEELLSR